jgi:predicted phage terminase large subunit-like protein
MNKKAARKKFRREWIRFLESWRPASLPSEPERFIHEVLGYKFMPFHRAWWEFTANHRFSLVLAPRGHGKSTILTVAYTLFRVLNDPDLRLLICSNTMAQAQAFLREVRHHLQINPKVPLAGYVQGCPWTDSEISLSHRLRHAKEATVTALGVMGPVISKHYDLIILDDVVDEAAASKNMRQKLLTWYYKELLPTLEPDGELHVLGTRYHPDDLYGRLIASGMPVLVEKAIHEEGGQERALWEEKFPLAKLQQRLAEAGPAIFNSQYQNDVVALRGRVFRPEWIVSAESPPPVRKYQGVDLAIGQGDQHDYFAHVTVAEHGPGAYQVVGAYQARLSFDDQFQAVRALYAQHDRPEAPVERIGVEANAYQEAMIQRLRGDALPVTSIVQTRDKITRALRMQGLFQTHRVSFPPRPDADLNRLIEQLLSFPEADHDDLVDALEIALSLAGERKRYHDLPLHDLDVGPREKISE